MLDKNIKPVADSQAPVFALGRQLTIEYYECGMGVLLSKDTVERALLKAANDSGATIISSSFHKFEPQGVSGVVIIAESHFTVHAWPEHDYAAVDIFTCGDNINLNTAIQSMQESFGSGRVVISSDQNRGIISQSSESKNVSDTVRDRDTLPISWKKAYEKKDPWGVLTSVDIYDCAPEIIRDTDGNVDLFVAGMGTTGTLMGCSRYFRDHNPRTKVAGIEPNLNHRIQGLKNMQESIVPKIYQPDLLDRSLLLGLERIPEDRRMGEAELWERFNQAKPLLLGAMFDALAKALRIEPTLPTP